MKKHIDSRISRWLIVPASALCISVSILVLPISTFGYFRGAMVDEFGWSMSAMSGAFTVLMILILLALPFAGRLADKFGARLIALVSAPLHALVILALGFTGPSLIVFYGLYALLAITGAGISPVVITRFITIWFEGNRALALGLALTGTGIGIAILPVVTQSAIDAYGWRTAYFVLAAIFSVVTIPSVAVFLREPESSVKRADPRAIMSPAEHRKHHPGFTAHEARGQRVFWQMASAFLFLGIAFGGIMPNLPLLLADQGISPMKVAKLQFLMGIASIVGRIIGGFLMDRTHAPYVGATFAVIASIALMILNIFGAITGFAIISSIMFGFAVGTEADLVSYLSSRYFGLRSYAEIYGWQVSAYLAGVAGAPFIVALLAEHGIAITALTRAASLAFVCSATIVVLLGPYPPLRFRPGS